MALLAGLDVLLVRAALIARRLRFMLCILGCCVSGATAPWFRGEGLSGMPPCN
jgi:hypothetical protein